MRSRKCRILLTRRVPSVGLNMIWYNFIFSLSVYWVMTTLITPSRFCSKSSVLSAKLAIVCEKQFVFRIKCETKMVRSLTLPSFWTMWKEWGSSGIPIDDIGNVVKFKITDIDWQEYAFRGRPHQHLSLYHERILCHFIPNHNYAFCVTLNK